MNNTRIEKKFGKWDYLFIKVYTFITPIIFFYNKNTPMEELKAYVIVVQTIALIASVLLAARFYFKYHIQREKNSRLWQALKNMERESAAEKEQQHDHICRHVA